jgi:ubiquitin-protein ligase
MAHFINYNPVANIINNYQPIPIIPANNNNPYKLKKHRLFLELEFLESNYKEVNVRMIHGKETVVEAKYPVQNQAVPKYIKFIIPKGYPFKPPEIFITSTSKPMVHGFAMAKEEKEEKEQLIEHNYLYTIHNCHLPRIQRLIRKTQVIKNAGDNRPTCLKCRSSLSHDGWSPALQMKHIFEEIRNNNKLKRRICGEIGLEEIFNKYKSLPEELMSFIRGYLYS